MVSITSCHLDTEYVIDKHYVLTDSVEILDLEWYEVTHLDFVLEETKSIDPIPEMIPPDDFLDTVVRTTIDYYSGPKTVHLLTNRVAVVDGEALRCEVGEYEFFEIGQEDKRYYFLYIIPQGVVMEGNSVDKDLYVEYCFGWVRTTFGPGPVYSYRGKTIEAHHGAYNLNDRRSVVQRFTRSYFLSEGDVIMLLPFRVYYRQL